MASINPSENMKVWLQGFIPADANSSVKLATTHTKLGEKWTEYGVLDKVRAKLEDGTYALTGDCTVDSVMNKSDDASIVLFDTYVQQEYDACQEADSDLTG